MDSIKMVAASACVSIIFYGLVLMLVPQGVMSKAFKNFAGIAIVASIAISSVQAFSKNDIDLRLELPSFDDFSNVSSFSDTVQNQQRQEIERSVRQLIEQQLSIKNIKAQSIEVSTDISDNGLISITVVDIICDQTDFQNIKDTLSSLGLDINIIQSQKEINTNEDA